MRVVYLHQYFTSPDMAGGTRSYEMGRRLVASGHEVDMITSIRDVHNSGGSWTESTVAGMRVHALPVPYSNSMGFASRVRAFSRFAFSAARKAASIPADVILATSTPLTIALPGAYASRRQNIPMVFEVRDLWPEMPIAVGALRSRPAIALARRLERFAYSNAASVIALSEGMRQGVVSVIGDSRPVVSIPNGCDNELFAPGGSSDNCFLDDHPYLRGGPLVVYAGTLGRVNNVRYLVDIAAQMSRVMPECKFVAIGEGAERAMVRSAAIESGVFEKSFWILDPVAKSGMPAVLDAATVATSLFVDLPQMWKNSANKFFDALAAGRPIMLNYQGWQAELVQKSGAGIVVPPDDAGAAARLLGAALADTAATRAMGQAARKLAIERFDRNQLYEEFRLVLENAAGA